MTKIQMQNLRNMYAGLLTQLKNEHKVLNWGNTRDHNADSFLLETHLHGDYDDFYLVYTEDDHFNSQTASVYVLIGKCNENDVWNLENYSGPFKLAADTSIAELAVQIFRTI